MHALLEALARLRDPVVASAGAGVLALILVAAAWHKLADRDGFSAALAAYRLLPAPLVRPVAHALVGIEAILALGALVPVSRGHALAGIAVLFVLYGAAIALNLVRGRREIDCGCGGPGQPLAWSLVVRNVLLAAAALAWAVPAPAREFGTYDRVAAVLVALGLLGLYLMSDELLRQAARIGRQPRAMPAGAGDGRP